MSSLPHVTYIQPVIDDRSMTEVRITYNVHWLQIRGVRRGSPVHHNIIASISIVPGNL